MRSNDNITILLNESEPNLDNQDQLFRAIYNRLREIAFGQLQSECNCNTYSVTSLVDESFCRITKTNDYRWQNRRQFYAAVATTMKRILIENARHNLKKGREHKRQCLEFQEDFYLDEPASRHIVNLYDALNELSEKKPELAELVQLKFFVGLDIKEIANVMDCSTSSIDRKWVLAKAWLGAVLSDN